MQFINSILNKFYSYYTGPGKYQLPQVVDLDADLPLYSFKKNNPEEFKKIQRILETNFKLNDKTTCLDSFLHESLFNNQALIKELVDKGFKIYSGLANKDLGIIFEPPNSNWLIKQTFSYVKEGNDKAFSFTKHARAKNLPFWLYPTSKWVDAFKDVITAPEVPSDVVNPLRVVTIQRGSQCAKKYQFSHICVPKEYLYRLKSASDDSRLHKKYIVISEKLPILDSATTFKRIVQIAEKNPEKLKKIVNEICLFILHTHLTDMHFENIRLLEETEPGKEADRIAIIDGEPIGGLRDRSQVKLKDSIESYDYATFPLIGLRRIQGCILDQGLISKIPSEQIEAVSEIFDKVIDEYVNDLIKERRWHYFKIISSFVCPVIPLALLVSAAVQTLWQKLRNNP